MLEIVKLMVETGADINRSADKKGEWTPSFYAKRAGHKQVAEWLKERMPGKLIDQQEKVSKARDPKYAGLYQAGTCGDGLTTDELVEILQRWDKARGIKIHRPDVDGVVVEYNSLPADDDSSLFEDAIRLCDDVADNKEQLLRDLKRQEHLSLWFD
jgi:hypothetical protein